MLDFPSFFCRFRLKMLDLLGFSAWSFKTAGFSRVFLQRVHLKMLGFLGFFCVFYLKMLDFKGTSAGYI